jgi:hypothetical protein
MPSYQRERAQSGSPREVIAALERTWPAGLFGERWHDLPAPDDELHGVLVWGPFELALHFRAVAAEDGTVRFALRHGPFTEFGYEARAEPHDDAVRLRETVTLDAPHIYGGARAARWFAAKLLPTFHEAAA